MSSFNSALYSVLNSPASGKNGFNRFVTERQLSASSFATSYNQSSKACCSCPNKRTRIPRPGNMHRYRKRVILKSGHRNIIQSNLHGYWLRFFRDPFTTLVDMQWRWNILIFTLSYVLSWLFFTIFWWLIAVTHEDLDEPNLPHNQEKNGWEPCFTNLKDFVSSFLFSIEVQTTLGYSIRMVTDECPEAIFLMLFQFSFGMIQTSFVVGFLYTKMTRAKHRTQTLIFSRKAVITQRDGYFYLMFRVGDMRKSNLVGASIRAQLISAKTTLEGDEISVYHTELEVGMDDCAANLFSKWPMIVSHRIDECSPFYDMSADDLFYESFEIVILLEGIIEATGHLMQARTSYINDEILWGRRFASMIKYDDHKEVYDIDYSRFDETAIVSTPLCTPRKWMEFKRSIGDFGSIPSWIKIHRRHREDRPRLARCL